MILARPVRTLAATAVLALVAAAGIGAHDTRAQDANVIFCYDSNTDVVRNLAPSQCDGEQITAAEAAEVKKRRMDRIRRAVQAPRVEVAPGKRLGGAGSGFFVTADGKVVTNHHVIDDCEAVSILPPDLNRQPATVVSHSKQLDFALLDTGVTPRSVVTFRNPVSRVADRRIALIGYPKNAAVARIKPFFTPGLTLEPRSPTPGFLALQFKADVRPGNSGGPLLDESGYVMGVVTAKINSVNVAKNTGELVTEVGYATDNDLLFLFLKANGIDVQSRAEGPVLDDDALFEAAKQFATRVECWK